MSVYSIYFSPTGGTKKVMDLLCQDFTKPVTCIDLSDSTLDFSTPDYSFHEKDLCFIGVPAYGGRVPAIALERLLKLRGNACRAVLTVVYGNRAYEDTLLELKEAADRCGFQTIAAVAALAEHSIMRQYAQGRPDILDGEKLRRFSSQIRASLEKGSHGTSLELPGNHPYREYNGVPLKPKAGKECTGCGACAAGCPVNAIPKDTPAQTNNTLCISCMRCIQICPVHARSLNKLLLAAAGQKLKAACASRKENELFLG